MPAHERETAHELTYPAEGGSRLPARSDLHIARKAWHAAGVCAMAAVFHWGGYKFSWITLACLATFIVPLDLLRQRHPGLNRAAVRVFSLVMRTHEIRNLSGLTYLIAGGAFLLTFFPKEIVELTLLFLAFGDPIASFCGIRFGRDRIIGEKTLQGAAGAFFACAAIAGIYFFKSNLMLERLWIVAPLSGFIGAAAEAIPVGKLDDNFTFPVIAGTLLAILFLFFNH